MKSFPILLLTAAARMFHPPDANAAFLNSLLVPHHTLIVARRHLLSCPIIKNDVTAHIVRVTHSNSHSPYLADGRNSFLRNAERRTEDQQLQELEQLHQQPEEQKHKEQKKHKQQHNSLNIEISQFDFSSQKGWDEFYRQLGDVNHGSSIDDEGQETQVDGRSCDTRTPSLNNDVFDVPDTPSAATQSIVFEFEWHNSIPHSAIIDEIMGNKESVGSRKGYPKKQVLLVGTGNSRLPIELYDFGRGDEIQVTCIDYSQPCIDMLMEMHAKDCPGMKFICGDVTDLENVLDTNVGNCENRRIKGNIERGCCDECRYDYIVDKGLLDALMCNDGWDGESGAVRRYFQQARKVMKSNGKIVLMTYKVNASTMEFLELVGNELGIAWEENVQKSNHRVSFLVGRCYNKT
jgi:hypothetical protein